MRYSLREHHCFHAPTVIEENTIVKATTIRRASVAGLAALALLGTTACSAVNLQATTLEYAPSDGVQANVDNVQLRNIALIAAKENGAGRFIGSLSTSDGEPAEVTITVNGESFDFSVPGNLENLMLEAEENETVVTNIGGHPGGMVDAEVSVNGTTEPLRISVLSAALPEYRDFLPEEVSEGELTDHLYDFPEHGGGNWVGVDEDGGH